MDELVEKMKVYLADNVAFGMKAQQYHWNVEGANFPQYHDFLGDLYQEVDGVIDNIGEFIRTLDAYAPLSPQRISELTNISETIVDPETMTMFRNLYNDNNTVINSIMECYRLAERFSEIGLSNFLQDRIVAHKKHQWMMRSLLKGVEQ